MLLGCAPRAPSSGQSASGTIFPKLSKWVLSPGTDQVRTAGAGSWEVSGPSLQGLPLLHPPTPFPAFRASISCLPGPLAGKLGKLRLFSLPSLLCTFCDWVYFQGQAEGGQRERRGSGSSPPGSGTLALLGSKDALPSVGPQRLQVELQLLA